MMHGNILSVNNCETTLSCKTFINDYTFTPSDELELFVKFSVYLSSDNPSRMQHWLSHRRGANMQYIHIPR